MKAAVIQMQPKSKDLDYNLKQTKKYILNAVKKQAKLIVLPELFNIGYGTINHKDKLNYAETINGKTTKFLKKLSKQYKVYISGTILEKQNNKLYSTMIFTTPDKIHTYRKTKLAFYEELFLNKGKQSKIINTKLGKFGLAICWDIKSKELIKKYSKCDAIILSSAWPEAKFPFSHYNKIITNKIKKISKTIPILFANNCGIVKFNLIFFKTFVKQFLGKSGIYYKENNKYLDKKPGIILTQL